MSNIYSILNMIDPYHSIIINEEIGLLGNNDFEVSKYIKDIPNWNTIKRIYTTDLHRRSGEYFTVIGKDGVALLDEYIDMLGIINLNTEGTRCAYCFKLKDYKAVDELEMSLYNWGITDNSNVFKPAVVLYIDNKLYTNCKELDTKYKYIDNIELIEITVPFSYMLESGKTKAYIGGEYTLNYEGRTYKSHPFSQENKIYRFRNITMHL